ncbi:ABC transporter permease [Candidatus Peregrinibacteria bacterium]|jgi:ABC-2 type transport system permease protein|nr:ABC transporter permease [Candidatus Peregrinibacteria bacterium]
MFFYNPIGFLTLTGREIKRFMKVYIQTIIAPLLTNMLFLGVFGGMFKTRQLGIEGVDYLSFLVPGLCAMGAIMSAYQNPSSSIIIQKYQNTIQDLNAYPITHFEKLMAFLIGGTVRGIMVGVLTYISTIYFVGYHIEYPLLFLLMLFLISLISSACGVIVGLVFHDFDKMSFILTIILTPMVYFGGVFFELSKLPSVLSYLIYINPLFPMVDLLRYSYLGILEGNMLFNISMISFLAILTITSSYFLFKKGVGLKY